jgi:hypothetical protein
MPWDKRNAYMFLMGKPNEKHYLEEVGVYGRIILKWVSNEWFGKT